MTRIEDWVNFTSSPLLHASFCKVGEFKKSWSPTRHEWRTYHLRLPWFFQILSEMDVYQVSYTYFVDALYDIFTAEDWWDQEITNIDITLYMTRSSHKTLTELFTTCQNLLKLKFLLPQRFYHLQICSEHPPNYNPNHHYILRYCMRASSPDAILKVMVHIPVKWNGMTEKKCWLVFFLHICQLHLPPIQPWQTFLSLWEKHAQKGEVIYLRWLISINMMLSAEPAAKRQRVQREMKRILYSFF